MGKFAVLYRYSTDAQALDEHRPAHTAYLGSLIRPWNLVHGSLR